MIRRAASCNQGTIASPINVIGFVLAWMIRIDSQGNQSLVVSFEQSTDGRVLEYPATTITFQDGEPAVIPEIQ